MAEKEMTCCPGCNYGSHGSLCPQCRAALDLGRALLELPCYCRPLFRCHRCAVLHEIGEAKAKGAKE